MVFGKWFGSKDKKQETPRENPELRRLLEGLDPTMGHAARMILGNPDINFNLKQVFIGDLSQGNFDKARQSIRTLFLPKFSEQDREMLIGGGAGWANFDQIFDARVARRGDEIPPDGIHLASVEIGDGRRAPLYFHGEGHLLTVAPTGAGKGQRFIVPSLLKYWGPTVVFDPKGENFEKTAWRRCLYGPVFKWAPGDEDSDFYNPLDFVETLDDAYVLADLMIVRSTGKDFWDDAAYDLLAGLIFYVKLTKPPERQNLRQVVSELAGEEDDFNEMVAALKATGKRDMVELANVLKSQFDKLRISIYASLRTHLKGWALRDVVRTTSSTTPGLSMASIVTNDYFAAQMAAVEGRPPGWHEPADGVIENGGAATIYLVVPTQNLSAMLSVLRVILGQLLNETIKAREAIRKEMTNEAGLPKEFPHWPTMFLFDELPQLGYVKLIEDAVAIARGYGIRLWLFTQDLAQLNTVYPKWESIVANCRCQIFFRPNDVNTATEIARRLGRRKDVWGGEDWVASPQKLMGPEFRDYCAMFLDGLMIRARMHDAAHENAELKKWIAEMTEAFGDRVLRAPRLEPPAELPFKDEAPDGDAPAPAIAAAAKKECAEEEDDDLSDDAELQREVAEAFEKARARRAAKRNAKNLSDESETPPESPTESSERPKRPPVPPSFDE